MKKLVFYSTLTILISFASPSQGQDLIGGLLGGQGDASNNGTQPPNQGGIRGVIRDQIQNAIQPNLPVVPNAPSNIQLQRAAQPNGQVGGLPLQSGRQPSVDAQPILNNQQSAGIGSQLLGVLRSSFVDQTVVGQDGTIRFRNDVNPQLRGMGIQPNDQLVDSNGMVIRDLNSASSFLQDNQSLRIRRNGQIVVIQPTNSNFKPNQVGWTFGIRNNGVFISSLVSNSIAARAGLQAGDQIISINGNGVSRPDDISSYLMQANSSATTVGYVRNGQPGEAFWNSPNQDAISRPASQSIQAKLDQIERLVGEIRAEIASAR